MRLRSRRLGTRMFLLSITAVAIGAIVLAATLRTRHAGTVRAEATISALTLARTVAFNSAAAVVFDDEAGARGLLQSFDAAPQFVAAAVLRSNGSVLAKWERAGPAIPPLLSPDGPPLE